MTGLSVEHTQRFQLFKQSAFDGVQQLLDLALAGRISFPVQPKNINADRHLSFDAFVSDILRL